MNVTSYIDVSARIRAMCPSIKEIDIFNRQYEEPQFHEQYVLPCVYLEWLPNVWTDNNDRSQQGLGGFMVHVCVPTGTVSDGTSTRNIDQATDKVTPLAAFRIFEEVHQALNGWMPAHGFITPFQRISDEPDHNYTSVMVMRSKYTAEAISDDTNMYQAGNWTTAQVTDVVANP